MVGPGPEPVGSATQGFGPNIGPAGQSLESVSTGVAPMVLLDAVAEELVDSVDLDDDVEVEEDAAVFVDEAEVEDELAASGEVVAGLVTVMVGCRVDSVNIAEKFVSTFDDVFAVDATAVKP